MILNQQLVLINFEIINFFKKIIIYIISDQLKNLQKKYSSPKYNPWLRRRGIRKRIRYFHKKAKNIIEDWVKKTSNKITILAKHYQYAVAREELTNLIESLRKLPKGHKVALLILSYRRLEFWIDWQCEKNGVPIIVIDPKGTSITCRICNSKLVDNSYRKMKCLKCRFEADRDVIAIQNIERKAKMQAFWVTLNASKPNENSSGMQGNKDEAMKNYMNLYES